MNSKINTQQIINFVQKLVQTPSQNGINPEKNVARLVKEKLKQFEFDYDVIGNTQRPSIVAKIGNPNGKRIWFEVMLDTVTAGDESKWDYPPFSAQIVNGKMYGRGTADSKVAIAVYLYLAKALKDNGFLKNNQLILGFDSDEQSGNFTGIREILKSGIKADALILGYGGIDEISIGARGWLRLRLKTIGKSAHTGSRSKKGINAIHHMAKVVSAFSEMQIVEKSNSLFHFGSSLNVSLIQGGKAVNIVPDECDASVDIRLIPGQDRENVFNQIRNFTSGLEKQIENLSLEIEPFQYEPPFQTDPNAEIVKSLKKNAERVLKREIPLVASGAGSVGNVVSKLNIPVINCFGVDCDNVHAPNEYIVINSVKSVFEIYYNTAKEFLLG